MANVIVAFQRPEHAKSIKNILMRSGFQVTAVCNSGAQALAYAEGLNSGVVVCGYQFPDMLFQDLYACLPREFSMMLISTPDKLVDCVEKDIVCLTIPLKVHELVSALELMSQTQIRQKRRKQQPPRPRSQEEQALITEAKVLLMKRKTMTEEEAHRYMQKTSMNSGTNMLETAQMVISLMN